MKQPFMHPDQLATLEAIAETGTFEAAAARLGISPSAASQRIRALESALGRILIQFCANLRIICAHSAHECNLIFYSAISKNFI